MPAEQFTNSAQTNLASGVSAAASGSSGTITVTGVTGFPALPQFRVRVGTELMLVTAMGGTGGTSWTVTRGAEGTTAPAHGSGAAVVQVLTAGAIQTLSPAGVMAPFAGPVPPDGWLACDGAAVSRTTYPALFDSITRAFAGDTALNSTTISSIPSTTGLTVGAKVEGTNIPSGATIVSVSTNSIVISAQATGTATSVAIRSFPWGTGNGSSTFNVPNLLGRCPIGAGAGSGLTTRLLGQQLGAETHTLSVTELASHNHAPPSPFEHFWARDDNATAGFAQITTAGPYEGWANNTTSTGGDAAHNNMQPSTVVSWIIKI